MAFIRPVLLVQRIDNETAWFDCLALSYAGCVFARDVSAEDVRARTREERETFDRRLVDSVVYCPLHPQSFRGCHCRPLGGSPNHERVRYLMWATCSLLRDSMAAWVEFLDFRFPEDGECPVRLPWTMTFVHPWRDLFSKGGAFHGDGPGLCSDYCQGAVD